MTHTAKQKKNLQFADFLDKYVGKNITSKQIRARERKREMSKRFEEATNR